MMGITMQQLFRWKFHILWFTILVTFGNIIFLGLKNNVWITRASSIFIWTNDSDVQNNDTWLNRRQKLLEKNLTTKVFLLAYMRGGSSIAGEIFNKDPDAVMWYEPGDSFFTYYYGLHHENIPQHDLYYPNRTRRSLDDDELQSMAQFYSQMLDCKLDDLPPEAMGHYFLKESTAMDQFKACYGHRLNVINSCKAHISPICGSSYVHKSRINQCHKAINVTRTLLKDHSNLSDQDFDFSADIKSKISEPQILTHETERFVHHEACLRNMKGDIGKCLHIALNNCSSRTLRVLQVNRMKMEDLEPLILENPDLYVIHYIRDPRAIALSRSKTTNLSIKRNDVLGETVYLCDRMLEDVRQRKLLEQKYPGVFVHVKYEDLGSQPVMFAKNIYELFGRTMPKAWGKFVKERMFSKNGGQFGISVKNASETANKWRSQINKDTLSQIQTHCEEFLQEVGYPIIPDLAN